MTDHLSPASEGGTAAQQERRQRILDATFALASQGGFEAVQMRSVADRADVALGTLYRYFPSKIHLLVTALAREFERAERALEDESIPGETAADRVIHVLRTAGGPIRSNQHLTEALTRAFMFADATAQREINHVATVLASLLTRAIHPEVQATTPEDVVVTRVIGDVWLASLVGWVTGRSSLDEAVDHMERAVRLVLRD